MFKLAWSTLFEELPEGVLVLDRNLLIVDMNSAARQTLNLDRGSVGKPIAEVLESWPELIHIIENNAQRHHIELKRNTQKFPSWFELTLTPSRR